MPFVIRARSRERSQRHFQANFWVGVAPRCVQQRKLNLELRSSTNATTVAVAKITLERGWRVGKKCLCISFWLTRRSWVHGKNCILGHPVAWATSYWLWASTNALKLAMWNLQIHRHRLPLWRKYALEVKAAKGLKRCWAKVKRVNNPAWTAQ